jgi:hypothetical protein
MSIFHCAEGKEMRRKEVTGRPDTGSDEVSARPERPVSGSSCVWRKALGFATGASDHSWDRRVRSCTQESSAEGSLIKRGGVSGHI